MEWTEFAEGKNFITDLGENVALTEGQAGFRYAIWIPENGTNRHQIVEVSNDIEALKKKYDVPCEMIMKVIA